MRWRDRLSIRLAISYAIFSVLVVGITGGLAYAIGQATIYEATSAGLQLEGSEKEYAFRQWLGEASLDIATLAVSPGFLATAATLSNVDPSSAVWKDARQRLLAEIKPYATDGNKYSDLWVLDAQTGMVLVSTDASQEGTYHEDRPYFQNGRNGPYIQNPFYSAAKQIPVMGVSAPLRATDGRLVGVLAAELDMTEMNVIIRRRTERRQSEDAFLVNTSHLLVTQPRLIEDPAILRKGLYTEPVNRCLTGESTIISSLDYRSIPVIASVRWIPARELCLIVQIDESEAFGPIRLFGLSLAGIVLLTALGAASLATWIAYSITRPIRDLQLGVERFGAGDYSQRVIVTTSDEIGRLGTEFNMMAVSLAGKEAQLRGVSQYVRNLIECSLDPLVTISPEGKITDVNQATEQVTGVSRVKIIDSEFSDYFTEPEEAHEGYQQVFAKGSVTGYPLTIRRVDGQLTHVLYNASVFRDADGNVLGVFAAARDITTQKEAEAELQRTHAELEQRVVELKALEEELRSHTTQLEASNQELEAFSYTVSHDLRAPLRAIDGFSRILLEEYIADLPSDGRRYLNLVRDNARQMGTLVDDLLAFSRLSRQAMRLQQVAPTTIAQQALEALSSGQEGRALEVTITDLSLCQADPALLKQVYINLISNALKFTRRREVARIEVGYYTEGEETVYFVKDNGTGFDMKYMDKIFGVFQRLHKAADYEGTGVGLAIVQRIIHRHGGRVWAEAELDKGATIYFTLGGENDA